MLLRTVVAACASAVLFLARAAAAREPDPIVTIVVHVPLFVPQAIVPHKDSYCLGDRGPFALSALPQGRLSSYETQLRAIGKVRDRFGFGTWTVGAGRGADVVFEADDHIFVTTRVGAASRVLPGLLRAIRHDLHQQEALAEVFGSKVPSLGQPRTRLEVVVPFAEASYARVRTLHRIFDDDGRSGASQYDDVDGVHVYSSVDPAALTRIASELRAAGFAARSTRSTFVTDDAPACSPARLKP